MIMIVKRFEFHAAHKLPEHRGKCKHLHGHTYHLEVGVSGEINQDGMIADFSQLKQLVKEVVIDPLDHAYLNDESLSVLRFPYTCPTAENMVEWMVDKLSARVEITGCKLVYIKLHETDNSYVEWRI